MHGRRLATTDRIIAVSSPDSDDAISALESWTDDAGVDLAVVDVGRDIGDVYEPNRATLGLTVGGDGTFLEGISTFAPRGVPIMGINTGTLSFLPRVEPEDLEAALDEVLKGRATVDSRQMLHADAPGVDATGINDVMVQHVPPENPFDRKITRLDVFLDDEYVGEFEGTGLAIATPTGSTGISLSANGPIQYPANNHALQLVPLHTHMLGTRPVILNADSELRVVTQGTASLLVDGGRAHTNLGEDALIRVTGAETHAHLVRTSLDDHFFTAVAAKLGWGVRSAADTGPREKLSTEDHGPEPDLIERARSVAEEAAVSVGDPLRELHGRTESITYKSDKSDIVTEADHQADRIITTVIGNEFPEHGIFSEESERVRSDSQYTWLIDPLDGTGNFAHGNPNYAVSIALLEAETPVMGVVFVPETGELFSARADGIATENDLEIKTTDRTDLAESMMLSGYDPDGLFLQHFYQETRGVRRLGCAALGLCYLAAGTVDAVWEYDTYPWDVAAGVCIARAAGATITDERGEPYEVTLDTEERTALLGSNGPLHEELLGHLESADAEVTG
ncbi:MAG: inositol monophosphatase family protein [Salinirussus sp.]